MDHATAVENNLTEKYLLSELDEAEREEFELHFFSCAACTADLKDGVSLIDGGVGILSPPTLLRDVPVESWWTRWFPSPARPAFAFLSAALLMVSGASIYQLQRNRVLSGELAEFNRPRQAPEFTLMAARRGPARTLQVPKGTREVQLMIDPGSDELFQSYRCEFRSASGNTALSLTFHKPVPILVPVSLFGPGELVIRVIGVRADASEKELLSHNVKIDILESR